MQAVHKKESGRETGKNVKVAGETEEKTQSTQRKKKYNNGETKEIPAVNVGGVINSPYNRKRETRIGL